MRVTVTILDRNRRWPRHHASQRQNVTDRMVESDNGIPRPSELMFEGWRGLDAPDNGPGTRLLALLYRLQHIHQA